MHLDPAARWTLARYLTGADPAELDLLASPQDRALALALRAADPSTPRPEALAAALAYVAGPDHAEALKSAILATDPLLEPTVADPTRSIREILRDPAGAPRFAVPNRLPVGLTLVVGRPKVGKSWALLDWAAAVAQGHPVLGVDRVQPGPVVYWALEDNWARIRARSSRIGIPEHIPLYFRTKPARLPHCLDEMAAEFARRRPRLFIVDTLSRILPAGASMNDSGEMTAALDTAQQLAFEHDAALVLVHHQRKNNQTNDHLDAVLGATGLTGAADAILTLTRSRGDDRAQLAITGRDIERELTLTLEWDAARCRWHVVDCDDPRPPAPTLSSLLLDAVAQLGTADAATLADRVARDRTTVQTELKYLRDAGRLTASTRPGLGQRLHYSLPGGDPPNAPSQAPLPPPAPPPLPTPALCP